MKTAQEVILGFNPCEEAKTYISGKLTIEEMVRDWHRGDWMLRIAKDLNIPLRPFTLAKALCAKTVFHLMKDEVSRNAVLVAEKFGNGLATKKELEAAYGAASAAAYGAYADAAYGAYADAAAAYASAAAAYAAATYAAADAAASAAYGAAADAAANAAADDAAADAAANAAADDAAADAAADAAYAAAKKENQKLTADICRETIGQLIIDEVKKLQNN